LGISSLVVNGTSILCEHVGHAVVSCNVRIGSKLYENIPFNFIVDKKATNKVAINKTIVESRDGRQGESDVNLKQGLPMKYSNFLTSGLTIQLGKDGDKNIKYELKSK
jgi:hypothetical protein